MFYLITVGEGFIMAGQLLLGLSILVILHEFGHYITAKWFGCRVEKFYLFFDPWFSLWKKKKGETEYGIGWLPLGGYVKIAGMIDESMDKEAMKLPPQPWEFRSKPAWQRLIIMLGGVIMNVLVAFIIYAFVLFKWGETKTPLSSLKYGMGFLNQELQELGLKSGDKIKSVDGKPVTFYEEVPLKLLIGTKSRTVVVERNGKDQNVVIPIDLINRIIENKKQARGLIQPRLPSVIFNQNDAKDTNTISYKAGIRNNDKIIAINSVPVQFYDEVVTNITANKDKNVNFLIARNEKDTLNIIAKTDCNGRVGLGSYNFKLADSLGFLKSENHKYDFLESFPAGVKKTKDELVNYIDQFKMILKPETGAYKGVGGFKGMANIYGSEWDWERFWSITAMISIILAFMNLLPIPALDGGHVMFTLWEMITRRKPNEKFLEYAQITGMLFLLGLMLYANGNDWFGWGKNKNTECPAVVSTK